MANNNNVTKVRFVRCPKCLKLLAEFSHVPVYRCGSCGKALKAKHSNAFGDGQNLVVGHDGLLNEGSNSSVEQTVDHSVELDDGANRESLETQKIGIEEKLQPNEGTKAEQVCGESRGKPDSSEEDSNGGGSVSSKIGIEDKLQSNEGTKAEQVCEESRGNPASSEEDRNGGGSVSSSSDAQSNGVPNKYRLLSKRTFRNSGSSGKGSVVSDVGISTLVTARNPSPLESKAEKSQRGTSWSPDSEDFHSVQNLLEVDDGKRSAPLQKVSACQQQSLFRCQNIGTSTDQFKYYDFNHTDLMQKVDEIRDKVDILLDKRVNEERKSKVRGSTSKFKSLQQQVHCVKCPPTATKLQGHPCCFCLHHHNPCCHHSREPNSRHDVSFCNPPLHHKTQREEDIDHKKLNLKEKRQANVKQYFLPVERGAPFVICSGCLSVLHLPPDFLVTQKKRLHRLRCGACSEVLVFRFRAQVHAGSSSAAERQHPPTEASTSHSNECYTEECRQFSLDQSSSVESLQFLRMPRNSLEIKNMERGCSSLHQLMGYDSASELLRLRSYSSED
ncbi:hypothetical protein J5N97_013854 [Dioscorea zingiberensis]|uniref:Zinc-ribbon domain-containing protein n=1 Tax=Dioscorea zingiberensis TaxID=325984 RepID=A0A9D5CRB5_9LILI|nr:hypothetical protein J5N97_013854 [Dioscorea zingiberensis]